MKTDIQFRYLAPNATHPEDANHCDHEIRGAGAEYLPLPNVGDTVTFLCGGTMVVRKVLMRHFDYSSIAGVLTVNIIVVDVSAEEMARRLKM
jgi:hypothetical protein